MERKMILPSGVHTSKVATAKILSEKPEGINEILGANIIIPHAPDPVFVSDLEGKILQTNDAVAQRNSREWWSVAN